MCQCEKAVNQAEQNESHAVAGIEAHPTPPHCCFFRNHRCNLAHADLQCGVTGPEAWPPECIDEVDDSERKVNARTENHENLCGQDALLMFGFDAYVTLLGRARRLPGLNHALERAWLIPFSFATISLLAGDAHILNSMAASFTPRPSQELNLLQLAS
jgi:hypothetical protein